MKLPGRLARLANRSLRRINSLIPNPGARDQEALLEYITGRGIPASIAFRPDGFRDNVLSFVESMRCDRFNFRYSQSVSEPTLYSSAYACMLFAMFGAINDLSPGERKGWADFFDSFQSPEDGLFRDPLVSGSAYESTDWWGARHFVLHAITVYAALGHVPKHPFSFVSRYKSLAYIDEWLASVELSGASLAATDFDNKVMNVVCALQFERDFRGDRQAAAAVQHIHSSLQARINPQTGLWHGHSESNEPEFLSRAVQFGYHLYLPMFFDGLYPADASGLIQSILRTQNKVGGYGVQLNSSACEDIDSIDLLCRLSERTEWGRKEVLMSLERALPWLLANQNEDGGFVFRRNEALSYGHQRMSSRKNESAMFPTWFRSLSVCYLANRLGRADFDLGAHPGLQFWHRQGSP